VDDIKEKEGNAVATDFETRHLTSERIQEFLDDRLSLQEAAEVQGHLSACIRCRSDVESWCVLFSDLEELSELTPGPAFIREVMARAPVRKPWGERIRGLLPGFGAATPGWLSAHLPGERLQEFLDESLPSRQAARVRVHLSACTLCREELEGWDKVHRTLGKLTLLHPSAGFRQRVMALVRISRPAPQKLWKTMPRRAVAWARSFLPQTRRGWAIAGGMASAPTITFGALIFLVFSHPLLSVGSFTTYLSWKAGDLLSALLSAVGGGLVESVALFRAFALVDTLREAPFLVGLGGLVFCLLSTAAFWVLYRNLFSAPSVNERYARIRV
jgi:anti-sigma factor RsiW